MVTLPYMDADRLILYKIPLHGNYESWVTSHFSTFCAICFFQCCYLNEYKGRKIKVLSIFGVLQKLVSNGLNRLSIKQPLMLSTKKCIFIFDTGLLGWVGASSGSPCILRMVSMSRHLRNTK